MSPSCLSINLIRRHLHVNVSHSKPHIFQRQRLKRLLLYNVHSDYIFLATADWQKAGWATQRREGTRADMCRFNLNFSYWLVPVDQVQHTFLSLLIVNLTHSNSAKTYLKSEWCFQREKKDGSHDFISSNLRELERKKKKQTAKNLRMNHGFRNQAIPKRDVKYIQITSHKRKYKAWKQKAKYKKSRGQRLKEIKEPRNQRQCMKSRAKNKC